MIRAFHEAPDADYDSYRDALSICVWETTSSHAFRETSKVQLSASFIAMEVESVFDHPSWQLNGFFYAYCEVVGIVFRSQTCFFGYEGHCAVCCDYNIRRYLFTFGFDSGDSAVFSPKPFDFVLGHDCCTSSSRLLR